MVAKQVVKTLNVKSQNKSPKVKPKTQNKVKPKIQKKNHHDVMVQAGKKSWDTRRENLRRAQRASHKTSEKKPKQKPKH